jgi:hypothetical protein
MNINYVAFWIVTPRTWAEVQHFGGTYCLNIEDKRVGQTRNRQEFGGTENCAWFLLGLLFGV